MTSRLPLSILILACLSAAPASADPALGLWQTQPDRKNLISHIEIRRCGAALCGRVKQAFDRAGKPVQTPNVGRELFWDLKPQGDGSYGGGVVIVPLLEVTAKASMVLSGNTLTVTGCKGPVCDGQTWVRVK
jgi:uncharacterized protein (DUF2147 family)